MHPLDISAQPEITTRENVEISADYPGIVCKMIEEKFGGIALFGLGLCGAQTPIYCEQGYEKMDEYANKIFTKIIQIYDNTKMIPANDIEIRSRKISLPLNNLMSQLQNLSRDKEIIAYCRGPFCVLADEAVKIMSEKGYRIRRLDQGYPEWKMNQL